MAQISVRSTFRSVYLHCFFPLILLLTACGGGGGADQNPGNPDALSFAALKNVAPGLLYQSEARSVTGLMDSASIDIEGADCTYAINDSDYTDDAGVVRNNDSIQVQGKASGDFNTTRKCALQIGSSTSEFAISTGTSAFSLTIESGRFTFDWQPLGGVKRYELVREDARSGEVLPVSVDISGASGSYTLPFATRLTDSVNDRFILSACNTQGCAPLPQHTAEVSKALSAQGVTYAKGSDSTGNRFGYQVVLSEKIMAVSAYESGVPGSGQVHVFHRDDDGTWKEEARLQSPAEAPDLFGNSLSLFEDALAVGARADDNNAVYSGAVYVFRRDDNGSWQQEAYLKASNADAGDEFGNSVALWKDLLVVGARGEDSADEGDETDNDANNSGAVYLFRHGEAGWNQEAYLKAAEPGVNARFGSHVALHEDTLAVAADGETETAAGTGEGLVHAGAAYVFRRDAAGTWIQEARLAASNAGEGDAFGSSLALSGDNLAVGAQWEASDATGVDGNQSNDGAEDSGAVYVFHRDAAGVWSQEAYLKASNTAADHFFGTSVALSNDMLAVGGYGEDSAATGINGDQANATAKDSGAVYLYRRQENGEWVSHAYVKPFNTRESDYFGVSVALSHNALAVGAAGEDSSATGVNGDQDNDDALESGAVYLY